MATVRATCPDCGEQVVYVRNMAAIICADTGYRTYAFLCPRCERRAARPVTPAAFDLLVANGARLVPTHLPAELFEWHWGPLVSVDEVIDFHLALRNDDQVEAAIAEMRETQS
jgi:hypothetical protein